MRVPNIYLDIDGVILANEHHLALHARDFVKHIVTNYPTYWLTTHCRGDANAAVNHISHFFDDEIIMLLKQIKPTMWDVAKTEAIDFSQPFLWFDDDLYEDEKEELVKNGALDSWIEVDLSKDLDALNSILKDFPQAT